MSIPVKSVDVDLTAANELAMADLLAEQAASKAEPAPVDTPTEAPVEAAPTPEPEAKDAVEAPLPIEVKPQDDNEVPTDPDELKKGWLRHRDYTQKTMSLAEERRAVEAERQRIIQEREVALRYQQELAAWRQLAQDPDALSRYAEQQRIAANRPAPDEPLTYEQTQSLLAQQAQSLRAQVLEEARQELLRVETARAEAQFFTELSTHAQALLDKHPVLRTQPGIERLIVEDARARSPRNVAEFRQFMAEEALERSKPLEKLLHDHSQAAIMRYAKAQQPSIAPRGGSIPAVQAQVKQPKLGSEEFYRLVEQDLLNELAQK